MTTASPGAATRRVPAKAWTLPARYYCDPAVFEREGERIHRVMWNAGCPVEELAEPGDYRLVEIAGDSVILVRDQEGTVRAHHNVCRHRGTRLLEAEEGCLAGSIQCPYHAWTYGLDGQLRAAPHMDEVEGFSVSDFRLAEARCEEWGGIVFVRVAEEGPDLEEQLGPAGARMGIWGLADLRSAHTVSYEVQANWKLIIQNFAECLHCPVIHPQLARLSHYLSGENYPADPNAIGAAMDLEEGIETLSTDGRLVGAPLPGLPAPFRRRVGYEILLPNALFCLHPDFVVRYLMRPLGVGHTSIRCDWLFSEGSARERTASTLPGAVEFWGRDETARDWRVSELSPKGHRLQRLPPRPPTPTARDHLWQIDQLILERLGGRVGNPERRSSGRHRPHSGRKLPDPVSPHGAAGLERRPPVGTPLGGAQRKRVALMRRDGSGSAPARNPPLPQLKSVTFPPPQQVLRRDVLQLQPVARQLRALPLLHRRDHDPLAGRGRPRKRRLPVPGAARPAAIENGPPVEAGAWSSSPPLAP